MADDFESQWNDVLKELTKKVRLSAKQKAVVTGAGAEVYKEYLKQETPVNENHSNGSPHLKDTIHYTIGKKYNGQRSQDGSTDVGFEKGEKTRIAYIVNNGSRKMSPKEISNMHFMERALQKSIGNVKNAEIMAIKKIMNGGGTSDSSNKGKSSD